MAAVLVIGGAPAAFSSAQLYSSAASGPHSQAPSCALSANCAGGGALSAGCAFIAVSDCGPRYSAEPAPSFGRLDVSDAGPLPSGVPTTLFHPPESSWI